MKLQNGNIAEFMSKLAIHDRAGDRKHGYLEYCRNNCVQITGEGENQIIEFTIEQHAKIRKDFAIETPVVTFSTPFNPKAHRTDVEQKECKSKCEQCQNYRNPNCCSLIPGCSGGLKLWWRNKLSHCPLPNGASKW